MHFLRVLYFFIYLSFCISRFVFGGAPILIFLLFSRDIIIGWIYFSKDAGKPPRIPWHDPSSADGNALPPARNGRWLEKGPWGALSFA